MDTDSQILAIAGARRVLQETINAQLGQGIPNILELLPAAADIKPAPLDSIGPGGRRRPQGRDLGEIPQKNQMFHRGDFFDRSDD